MMPTIIAIAGPKGGCGKTTLAVGLAQTLTQRNKSVCIVDLDPYGQNATFALHLDPVFQTAKQIAEKDFENALNDFENIKPIEPRKTYIPLLSYIALDPNTPDFFEPLCSLQCDYVILDMPAGFRYAQIFDDADFSILTATPEPASIFEASQWLHYIIDARLANDVIHNSIPAHGNWTFNDVYHQLNEDEAKRFEAVVSSYRIFFVLNQRREGSEFTQSDALCHAWWRYLGTDVRPLGSLRFEERRWFFTRQFSTDDPLNQDDSMQDDLDKIVDKILANQWQSRPCGATVSPILNATTFLTTQPDEEPRHAYRRLYEGYRRETSLVSWAFSHERIQTVMNQIDAAWTHIHNENNPGSSHLPAATPKSVDQPVLTSTGSVPTSMTRRLSETYAAASYDPGDCEPNAGEWLRACRERVGMSLPMLAMRTRIAPKNLDLIENTQIQNILPSYLQGYLFEIAKVLDLPLDELRRKFGFKD